MEQKNTNSIINTNDLKLIWRIFSKNWYIPILFGAIFYLVAYFYTYKLTNTYQASVELLKSNDNYYKDNLVSDQGYYGVKNSYVDNSNEIRIVKSYDLMKETVLKLKNRVEVSYYLIGRVRTTEQFSGVPFNIKVNVVNPNLFETKINFKIIDYNQFQLTYFLNGHDVVKTGKFGEDFIDVDFNLLFSREANLTRNTIIDYSKLDYQIVIHKIDKLVHDYQKALKVENPDYTNVLVLTFEDILPERAVLILDTLSKVYLNKSLNARFELNERTINYIDKQLSEVSLSLDEVEDTMQMYKRNNDILDLSWEKQDYFDKLARYDGDKASLNLKLQAINDLEKYIIEDKDPEFLPPSVYLVSSDAFMTKSVNELYELQISINEQLSFSKEINPHVMEDREKVKKLKQNILVYLNNSRNATYKIIENINGEISKYVL